MSLKDQAEYIKKVEHGIEFTPPDVYNLYASAILMIYYTYVSKFLLKEVHGNEDALAKVVTDAYDMYKAHDTWTTLEADFVTDYEFFVLSDHSAS